MESLLRDIIGWLVVIGPEVVFVVVMAETAFFLGLLVPAEATVLVAAFLANRGTFELSHVLAATLLGGFAGDQIGYALGRFGGRRVAARGGRLGRLWSRNESRAGSMFRRRSIVSVTLARFVSFVRTIMPWMAGMSRMPYLRFLVFDALGVLGWGIGSVAAGYLAGESWRQLASALGITGGIIVVVLALAGILLFIRGRKDAGEADPGASSEPGSTPDANAPVEQDVNSVRRASR